MPKPYFFYGTLTDDDVVRAILGRGLRELRAQAALLTGYRRVYAAGTVYPALEPNPGHEVSGLMVDRLSARDVHRLDRFEGSGYRATALTVSLSNGQSVDAMVYLPLNRIRLSSVEWTLADWQRHHKRKSRPDWDGPLRPHRRN